jgi:hypothetical protein
VGNAQSSGKAPRPGTSRPYLIFRLQQGGHHELLAAVEARRLSAYAAAVQAGIVRRPEARLTRGNSNRRKRIDFAIRRAFRDGDGSPNGSPVDAAAPAPEELAAASFAAAPRIEDSRVSNDPVISDSPKPVQQDQVPARPVSPRRFDVKAIIG